MRIAIITETACSTGAVIIFGGITNIGTARIERGVGVIIIRSRKAFCSTRPVLIGRILCFNRVQVEGGPSPQRFEGTKSYSNTGILMANFQTVIVEYSIRKALSLKAAQLAFPRILSFRAKNMGSTSTKGPAPVVDFSCAYAINLLPIDPIRMDSIILHHRGKNGEER